MDLFLSFALLLFSTWNWVEGSPKAILIGSPKDIDRPLTQVLGIQEINQGFCSLKEH